MENKIEIPTGDPQLVKAVMEDFNSRYKTNFSIVETEDRDGVEFVVVDRGTSQLTEVFLFGFFCGATVQEKRLKGEINY